MRIATRIDAETGAKAGGADDAINSAGTAVGAIRVVAMDLAIRIAVIVIRAVIKIAETGIRGTSRVSRGGRPRQALRRSFLQNSGWVLQGGICGKNPAHCRRGFLFCGGHNLGGLWCGNLLDPDRVIAVSTGLARLFLG